MQRPIEAQTPTISPERPTANLVTEWSIPSVKHPERNEDATTVFGDRGFAVFDGMGGYSGGQEASRIARDIIDSVFLEISAWQNPSRQMVIDRLVAAMTQIHLYIQDINSTRDSERKSSETEKIVWLPPLV